MIQGNFRFYRDVYLVYCWELGGAHGKKQVLRFTQDDNAREGLQLVTLETGSCHIETRQAAFLP